MIVRRVPPAVLVRMVMGLERAGPGASSEWRPAVSKAQTAAPMLVGASRGLSSAEAASRLSGHGRNQVRSPLDRPLRKYLHSSLTQPLVLLLLAVGIVYAVLGVLRDAALIFVVILIVASMEAWTEWRANRAISALSHLSAPRALVWRDRRLQAVTPDE